MERSIVILRAPFAYIHSVYDFETQDYKEVEDWYTREQRGLPPEVVIASQRNNKFFITKDVRAGGVYPPSNFVYCSDPETDWDVLERFVGRIGYATALSRRKLMYNGGKYPWQKCLCPTCKERELWSGGGHPA